MAEHQSQERTEQATPKRRQDAREKGEVLRSRELNTLMSLLAAAGGMFFFGRQIIDDIQLILVENLSFGPELVSSQSIIPARFAETLTQSVTMLLPLFVMLVVITCVSPLSLGGWVFDLKLTAPKLERISPVKGFGRLFSPRSLMELFKALGKFFLVGIAACVVLYVVLEDIISLSLSPLHFALGSAGTIATWCLLGFSSVLILVVAMDVPFQAWQFNRKLRMTKQEVKDELKDTEGRPEVKSTIREKQQQFAKQRMMAEVANADVVITNPTHFAVALKYDQLKTGAPVVVAKGRNLIATRIREIAEEHGVTVFSAPPLARALYFSTDLNQEIPRNLFLAVAQVLAYLFQLRQVRKPGEQKPVPPKNLPVPEEYTAKYGQGDD